MLSLTARRPDRVAEKSWFHIGGRPDNQRLLAWRVSPDHIRRRSTLPDSTTILVQRCYNVVIDFPVQQRVPESEFQLARYTRFSLNLKISDLPRVTACVELDCLKLIRICSAETLGQPLIIICRLIYRAKFCCQWWHFQKLHWCHQYLVERRSQKIACERSWGCQDQAGWRWGIQKKFSEVSKFFLNAGKYCHARLYDVFELSQLILFALHTVK